MLVLGIALMGFSSCNKEEAKDCNCGIVKDDRVYIDDSYTYNYYVTIQNDCSSNYKEFSLSYGDWLNAGVNENYCITNVTGW